MGRKGKRRCLLLFILPSSSSATSTTLLFSSSVYLSLFRASERAKLEDRRVRTSRRRRRQTATRVEEPSAWLNFLLNYYFNRKDERS